MPRTLQVAPAKYSNLIHFLKRDSNTARRAFARHHGIASLAPPVVAGAMLLIATEPALAQAVNAPAAIATEGAGPLGLGALVGAGVAGGFALSERFRRR